MIIRRIALAGAVALIVPGLLVVLGCSSSDLGTLYKVTGTVKYKGEPVSKARINFVPSDPAGHAAYGQVEDGNFSLSTLQPGDGALPGKYDVTVDDRETDDAKLQAEADKFAAKNKIAKLSMIPQEFQAKALAKAKGRLPGKYQIPSTTDLHLTIGEKTEHFEIELKD